MMGLTVLTVVIAFGIPLVLVEFATNPGKFSRMVRWVGLKLHIMKPEPPPTPQSGIRPLETLAVEIRRLGRVLADPGSVSAVRWLGVEHAYDEALKQACGSLGIQHYLDQPGMDHEFERLRAESALQEAGLLVRGPTGEITPCPDDRAHRRWRRPA